MRAIILLAICALCAGCMTINITARERSSVTVSQEKPVNTSGTASIPADSLGALIR